MLPGKRAVSLRRGEASAAALWLRSGAGGGPCAAPEAGADCTTRAGAAGGANGACAASGALARRGAGRGGGFGDSLNNDSARSSQHYKQINDDA
jgi:hypothetical protein